MQAFHYASNHPDHLNTPRLVANDQQQTVWKWEQQEPFGANACNPDPDGDNVEFEFNLRFPGQYFDRETNQHYNYFRDYEPGIGRYLQADPLGALTTWPNVLTTGLNHPFAYVASTPLQAIDTYGLAPECNTQPCLKVLQIDTKFTGTCPAGCTRFAGSIQWWTCFPHLRIHEPRCICGVPQGARG